MKMYYWILGLDYLDCKSIIYLVYLCYFGFIQQLFYIIGNNIWIINIIELYILFNIKCFIFSYSLFY